MHGTKFSFIIVIIAGTKIKERNIKWSFEFCKAYSGMKNGIYGFFSLHEQKI
jgi:hypothetical protein